MLVDIALSALAFAAVLIAVYGEATKERRKNWKPSTTWGWAALGVGCMVFVFSIVKSHHDSQDREELLGRLADVKRQLIFKLQNQDLFMRLIADYRSSNLPDDPAPDAVRVEGYLGKASFKADLFHLDTPTIPGGGRAAGYTRYLYDSQIVVIDLAPYPTLFDLGDVTFGGSIVDARKKFPVGGRGATNFPIFYLDLYIRGRGLAIHVTHEGQFQQVLNLRDAGLIP